jgi:hypothetical protein
MDFSARVDELQQRVTATKSAVQAAATESRDQLRQRIDQAQQDAKDAQQRAQQRTDQTADRARGKWAQMKADAAAKMDDIQRSSSGSRPRGSVTPTSTPPTATGRSSRRRRSFLTNDPRGIP